MTLTAKVESAWDDGSPQTLRDENGGLWRVAVDAVETAGNTPCGVAEWSEGDELVIYRAKSHGENHTDPDTYGVNDEGDYVATANGWEASE